MVQIFVVEDELLIRQSIRSIIERMPGPYAFAGEASDGEMALSLMQDLMPDILLTDIRMPFLDGLELIRNVKGMMPWLKIIILSGYGDFEYAQKAIGLGVDRYLLKPVRAAELQQVIAEIARQIDQDRARAALPGGYDPNEVQTALKNQFLQDVLYGGSETGALLERARALSIDIVASAYLPVAVDLEPGASDPGSLRSAAAHALDQLGVPLYRFQDTRRLSILISGDSPETALEKAYRCVAALRHALEGLCPVLSAAIGSCVPRLGAIPPSYRTAEELLRRVTALAPGAVVTPEEGAALTAQIAQASGPFDAAFRQKLRSASSEDVPELLSGVIDAPELRERFGSALTRYHALVELLRIAVAALSGRDDAEAVSRRLSEEYDLMGASQDARSFRAMAEALLRRAVQAGQGRSAPGNPVIQRAVAYVEENFCDPNITLIHVARHVGMSSAHFSTVFSQTMGISFIGYLTQLRMERARQLLKNSDRKLADIATAIGYSEPNYFSHVFRKSVGMTPKEYRNSQAAAQHG